MKTIQKIIISMLVLFIYSHGYAQQVPQTRSANSIKNYNKNVPYIFEGHVIQTIKKEIAESNVGNELVCSVVQITKIYKGSPQLKLGTIKVISEDFDNTVSVEDIHFHILKDGRHVIFSKLCNSHIFDSIATDNSITLSYSDDINLIGDNIIISNDEFKRIGAHGTDIKGNHILGIQPRYWNSYGHIDSVSGRKQDDSIVIYRTAATWFNIKFPTMDSLNSFLKNNGLVVQEEGELTDGTNHK